MRLLFVLVGFSALAACGNLKTHGTGGGGGGLGGGFSSSGGGVGSAGGGIGTGGGIGSGGGFASGGGVATGGGSSTGGGGVFGGGGGSMGGGSGVGGGQVWGFDDAGFHFTQVVPEPNDSNHGDYDRVTGLGASDLWVSDSYGFLRHFDGSQWTLVYDFGVMLRYTGLYERSDQAVFASGDNALISCTGNCTAQVSYVSATTQQASFTGVCGAGNEVFASGGTAADGPVVMHFNGSGWDKWLSGAAVQWVGGCAVASSGEVLIAMDDAIGVFSPDGGAFHTEAPGFGSELLTRWEALAPLGNQIIAVGPGKKVSVRDAQGNWSPLVYGPSQDSGGNYLGVTSATGSDAVIAGTQGPAGPAAVYQPGHLTLIGQPETVSFFGVWAQDSSTVYFSGHDVSSGYGVLYRATR